jgi:hypothetical protein
MAKENLLDLDTPTLDPVEAARQRNMLEQTAQRRLDADSGLQPKKIQPMGNASPVASVAAPVATTPVAPAIRPVTSDPFAAPSGMASSNIPGGSMPGPAEGVNPFAGKFIGAGASPQPSGTAALASNAGAPDDHFLSDLYKKRIQDYETKKENPWGSENNHPGFLGKLGHGLATAGNIALDVFAPEAAALIPHTALHGQIGEKRNEAGYESARSEEDKASLERAEAHKAMNPQDKPVGTPQIGENGNFWQAVQHPDGKHEMIDMGVKAHPNTGLTTIEDPQNPGHYVQVTYDKNAQPTTAGTNTLGNAKPPASMKPTIKMVPLPGGMEQLMQLDPQNPDDMTKAKKIGAPEPLGSRQLLVDPTTLQPTGTFSTKTGVSTPFTDEQKNGATNAGVTPAAARVANQRENQFNQQVINPARALEANYQKATAAVDAYNHDPKTGAAGMVLFAQHLGTTLGSIKGAAIGEGSQELHMNAIGLEEKLSRFQDYLATGQPLSAAQVKDFYALVTETRGISWDLALREGLRRQEPINFLPPDMYRTGKTQDGKPVWQRKDDPKSPVISQP